MKKILPLFALLFSAACTLTPAFHRPDMKIPAQWKEDEKAAETDLTDWWKKFKSPELESLEDKALAQNLDVRAAVDRITQARAAEKIIGAALLPDATATAGISSAHGKTGGGPTTHSATGNAGVNVSYDLDLFGANRAALAAARADTAASVFDHEAVALAVSSDVAETYAGALALKGRIYVASETRRTLQKTLDILQDQFKAGAVSALEVAQQKTEVANADASIAALEDNLAVALDALAVLEGEAPQDFKISAASLGDLALPDIAPGQPSELLERRPDIREAEANLVAANADIGVARAAFFPSLTLGLGAGINAVPLAGGPAASALSLAAGLTAPLFRGGSLEGGVEKATARERELAEAYRKTVLIAFQETEDALAAAKSAEKRRSAYTAAVAAATRAYTLADQKFKAGAIDYPTLLDTQRSLLAAKDNLVSANLDRLNAAITLYKALGGGWRESAKEIKKEPPPSPAR